MSRRQMARIALIAAQSSTPRPALPLYLQIAALHQRSSIRHRDTTTLPLPTHRRQASFWPSWSAKTDALSEQQRSNDVDAIPFAPPGPDQAVPSKHADRASPRVSASASDTIGPSDSSTSGSQWVDNASPPDERTVSGHGQTVHVLGGDDGYPDYPFDHESSSVSRNQPQGIQIGPSPGVNFGSGPFTGNYAGEGRRKERKHRYLDSLMDKAGEVNLRCSVLDADGNWTQEERRFKKTELCKQYDLDPRDLRKLDSLAPNLVPIILTRRTCILISILHVRALIKPDKVIIFNVPGVEESEAQRRFKLHLERNVKAGRPSDGGAMDRDGAGQDVDADEGDFLPYEHRALESILVATANALEEEMAYTRSLVRGLLADLEDDINRENLKRLLHYSRRMVGFQSRARYVKQAVVEILDNDEDLSAMYLTSTSLGRPRALHDHEQLELLLESFTKQVEEIVSEIDNTVANIQSTQEIAELMLDSGRNALLALDIKISFATLGAGCAAVLAGFFGMNLQSHLEDYPYAFYLTTASATVFGLFIFTYGLRHLRRVRRVALSDRTTKRSGRRHMVVESLVAPAWEHLPSVDPLTGAPRAVIDRDLVKRSRAAEKRMIWDMISRSKSKHHHHHHHALSHAQTYPHLQAQAHGPDGRFVWTHGQPQFSPTAATSTSPSGAMRDWQFGQMLARARMAGKSGAMAEHVHARLDAQAAEGGPVYMGEHAHQAKAREWTASTSAKDAGTGLESELRKGRQFDPAWAGAETERDKGMGGAKGWETAPWKWGRGKVKWHQE